MARRTKAPAKGADTEGEKPDEAAAAEDTVVEPIEIPEDCVFIGKSVKPEYILLKLANRHGLITGATGTGKTVTLQGLAEAFSDAGVPVFCADVKGDLSGVAAMGKEKGWITERAAMIGYDVKFSAHPVIFWDLFGEQGHPVRTTVSELGPLMLSRLMDLSEAQEGVMNIAFRIADEEELPLLDLKDLQSLLENLAARAKDLTTKYGTVGKRSIGAIQRQLLVLEQQGGDYFFGEPALDVGKDLMRTDDEGRGYIGVLAADKLMQSPRLYGTFLLFLLSELFEELPEIGDPEKPTLVFFFDEAHLLFRDAPKALLEKVEQVVRLIRSKGVGVYFVTQNPRDVPDTVSRQLGNRVQHALRAFTPAEQKAVKSAAETFRPNPELDTEQMIMSMGIGEALVSSLDEKGQPSMVQHTFVKPPSSQVGPIALKERKAIMAKDPVAGVYDDVVDRESAHEILQKRTKERAKLAAEMEAAEEKAKGKSKTAKKSGGSRGDSFWTALGKTVVRTGVPMVTRVLEDAIRRNVLGGHSRRR